MDIATFHASRRFADVASGRIAYVEQGQVLAVMERARTGTLAPVFQALLDRPDAARARFAKGESVPLFRSYADPGILTDDLIRLYLQPLLASAQRIDAFQRYWLGFDNIHTVAIHGA